MLKYVCIFGSLLLLVGCGDDSGGGGNNNNQNQSDCGNGIVSGAEACDDANLVNGDGCDASCRVETGWSCAGEPSVCTQGCGNGTFDGNEECDDGNNADNDGCSASCAVEAGWSCAGQPSVCNTFCGDGIAAGSEGCDDGGTTDGDGCDVTCQMETGWNCTGNPSTCAPVCGDGMIIAGEGCDDTNSDSGDGCDATCQVEIGWDCTGEPSICVLIPEICDNNIDDDDANLDADCNDVACAAHASCELGYNLDFEDWTATNPPTRFETDVATDITYDQETTNVNRGSSSACVTWTTTEDRNLDYQLAIPVTEGTYYTFHAWMYGNGITGHARMGLVWPNVGENISSSMVGRWSGWLEEEYGVVAPAGATSVIPRMLFEDGLGFDPQVGATVCTDDWAITVPYSFTVGPNLDPDTTQVLTDGSGGFVYVGLSGLTLYVATQAGRPGVTDRFVYVYIGEIDTNNPIAAPWTKAGTVYNSVDMCHLVVLADEGENDFCAWYYADTNWSSTGGTCYDSFHDGTNLLTGSIDLVPVLTEPLDSRYFYVSSVEYGTGNGGGIVSQMPAPVVADDNVDQGEYEQVHRATILSGKIHN